MGGDKGDKDKGGKDKGDKDKGSKDKGKGKGKKDKDCDDSGEWWSTEDPFWTTDDDTEEPTNEPSMEPTAEPTMTVEFLQTVAPSTDPTSEPTTAEPTTAEPTTADPTTAVPTTAEPTTAEPTTSEPTTAEPTTAEPTTAQPTVTGLENTPSPTAEPTVECPEDLESVSRSEIPCECYAFIDCPTSDCYAEETDGTCNTMPEAVAVVEERQDANAAEAVAMEETIPSAASETDHGLLIAALLVGVAVTAIAFGLGLYCWRKRKTVTYTGFSNDCQSVSEQDTAQMMQGSMGGMVWETNVLAHEHQMIMPEDAVDDRV